MPRGFKSLHLRQQKRRLRASFLLAWGAPAPCSGAACALILRKGGTAMVPPSHFPLLAEEQLPLYFGRLFCWLGSTCPVQRVGLCPDITQRGNRNGSPFTLPPPCGGTVAFMFRASFLLAWGTPAPCSGAPCALLLRKGGTAMVPPSHFPLLAEGRLPLCFGRLFCWRGRRDKPVKSRRFFACGAHFCTLKRTAPQHCPF